MSHRRWVQLLGIAQDRSNTAAVGAKRRLAAAVGVGVLLVSLVPAGEAHAAPQPPTPTFPKSIDPFVSYDAQDTCDPTAKPGTQSIHDFLLKTYPISGDFGITRACNIGSTSEHKEGRAWDWKLNFFNDAQRDVANTAIKWWLKTDEHGNACALARRQGLMYFIWNNRIWGGYRSPNGSCASAGWKDYTGSNPHTDHIHISWGWPGAKKQTSWWTEAGPVQKTLKAKLVQKWSNAKRYRGTKADYIVCSGQPFKYSFTFKNVGSATWRDVEGRGDKVGSDVFMATTSGKKDKLSGKLRFSVKRNKNFKVRGDRKAPNCSNEPGCRKTTFIKGAIQVTAPAKPGLYYSKWRLRDFSKTWGQESHGFGPKVQLGFRVKACTTGECGCWAWCTDGSKRKIAAEGSDAHCKEVAKSMCEPAQYLKHQYTPCSTGTGGTSGTAGTGGTGGTSSTASTSGSETGGGEPMTDEGEEGAANAIVGDQAEGEYETDEEGYSDDGFNGDEEGITQQEEVAEEGEFGCSVASGASGRQSGTNAALALLALGAAIGIRRRRSRR